MRRSDRAQSLDRPTSPKRRSRSRLSLSFLLITASATACLSPSVTDSELGPDGVWYEYADSHLTVYSQLDGWERGRLEDDITWARDVAAHFTGLPLRTAGVAGSDEPPAQFFLVGNDEDHWTYSDTRDRNFVVSDSPSGSRYILDGRRRIGRLRSDLFEAIAHDQLQRAGAPVWYQIGFGAMIETMTERGGNLVVGSIDPMRVRQLWKSRLIDIHEILEPGRLAELSPANRRGHEAFAWLMVHYLTIELDGEAGQTAAARLEAYNRAMRDGATPAEALESAWGLTPSQLARRVRAFAIDTFKTPRVPLERVPRASLPAIMRVLPPGERLTVLGDLFTSLRDVTRAALAYHAALRSDRGASRALAGLARVAADTGKIREALDYANRAVEAAPNDPRTLATRGLVQARAATRAQNDHRPGLVEQARQDLEFALALAPDDGEALFAHGASSVTLGEAADVAITSLERAHQIVPRDRAIRLALLDGYVRAGRHHKAQQMAGSLRSDARTRTDLIAIDRRLERLGPLSLPPWQRH